MSTKCTPEFLEAAADMVEALDMPPPPPQAHDYVKTHTIAIPGHEENDLKDPLVQTVIQLGIALQR